MLNYASNNTEHNKSPIDISQISRAIYEDGIILLEGITSDEQAKYIANQLGQIVSFEPSDNGIIRINNVDENNIQLGKGYTNNELFFHTDRSSLDEPPHLLMLWCEKPAPEGGESLLVDGRELFDSIKKYNSKLLTEFCNPKSAFYSSGESNYLGSIFESMNHGKFRVRFRNDKSIYFNKEIAKYIDYLYAQMTRLSNKIKLQTGDCYIIQNWRWLHGRNSFKGNRQFNKIHINVFEKNKLKLGFNE